MYNRLILGSGSLIPTVISASEGDMLVGTPDERLAETLRELNVAVEPLSPTNGQALARTEAAVVFVVENTSAEAVASARAVKNALPDAYLLVYTGTAVPDKTVEQLADAVIHPADVLAERILASVSNSRVQQLWAILGDISHLAVVTHDNPDPDAIASGLALCQLAHETGCEATLCYYGEISHQENRAFVNVLDLNLHQLSPDDDLTQFDGFALVDHARPGINDGLPTDLAVDIVIDHHPPRGPVEARFVDLRSDVGATSTLLVEYFEQLGSTLNETVATALLFGIYVDTHSFTRGVDQQDFSAAASLVRVANFELLNKIEAPSIDPGTLNSLADAITNRRVERDLLFSCVGTLTNRDALSQAADRLLRLEGVTTTVISGLYEGTVYVSARSRNEAIDIGETLRDAFDHIGSAGGHADMAGAQLDLGVLEVVESDESLVDVVSDVIAESVLEALASGPQSPQRQLSHAELHDRYTVPSETPVDPETDS